MYDKNVTNRDFFHEVQSRNQNTITCDEVQSY